MSEMQNRVQSPGGEDPFDLARFVTAQETVYPTVLSELRSGQKQSHWMWYIFPQIAGLGFSPMAQRYAIANLDEATQYLAHPILGARLRECAQILLSIDGRSASAIFGFPDDRKLQSSITLFAQAATTQGATDNVFNRVLEKYFKGKADAETLRRIA